METLFNKQKTMTQAEYDALIERLNRNITIVSRHRHHGEWTDISYVAHKHGWRYSAGVQLAAEALGCEITGGTTPGNWHKRVRKTDVKRIVEKARQMEEAEAKAFVAKWEHTEKFIELCAQS